MTVSNVFGKKIDSFRVQEKSFPKNGDVETKVLSKEEISAMLARFGNKIK